MDQFFMTLPYWPLFAVNFCMSILHLATSPADISLSVKEKFISQVSVGWDFLAVPGAPPCWRLHSCSEPAFLSFTRVLFWFSRKCLECFTIILMLTEIPSEYRLSDILTSYSHDFYFQKLVLNFVRCFFQWGWGWEQLHVDLLLF